MKVVVHIKLTWYMKLAVYILPRLLTCNLISAKTAKKIIRFLGNCGGIKSEVRKW